MMSATLPSDNVSESFHNVAHDGDWVLLQGEKRDSGVWYTFVKIRRGGTARIFKKEVALDGLLGAPFGSAFVVEKRRFCRITHSEEGTDVSSVGEVLEDNRNITDSNTAQKLKDVDILDLKNDGVGGERIVQELLKNSSTFSNKTAFSQQKWLRKKLRKHRPTFRLLACTAMNVCVALRLKNPQRIFGLREDSLARILTIANVHCCRKRPRTNTSLDVTEEDLRILKEGWKTLVFENCGGLITASAMQRQDGCGCVINAYVGRGPDVDLISRFNFSEDVRSSVLHLQVGLARPEEERRRKDVVQDCSSLAREDAEKSSTTNDATRTDKTAVTQNGDESIIKPKKKLRKRRLTTTQIDDVLLDGGGVDSLIIATNNDTKAILEALFPLLLPSRTFVLFSPYIEPLVECQRVLERSGECVMLRLTETWMREQQVLPGRTHPMMSMDATSGFILSGVKIVAEEK